MIIKHFHGDEYRLKKCCENLKEMYRMYNNLSALNIPACTISFSNDYPMSVWVKV